MEELIARILNHPLLVEKPPVLVDIGASGEIHAKWKRIAPYSICIAFDADSRDFAVTENEQGDYKKLYVFNCIVSDREEEAITFYLTKSPYCSSSLHPDNVRLKNFIFAPLFEVEKEISLKNISLAKALKQLNIENVDWFKSDSQGTDLRLFKNMPGKMQETTLLAEFEPGILDAYIGEDKMYAVMEYMDASGFLLTEMDMKKVQYIPYDTFNNVFKSAAFKRFAKKSVQGLPAWAELTYFNRMENTNTFSLREYLLASLFALLQEQYALAMSISKKGKAIFKDSLLADIEEEAQVQLVKKYHRLGFLETIIQQVWEKWKG